MDSETDDGKNVELRTHCILCWTCYIYRWADKKKGKIDWINIKRKCRDKFNKNKTNSQ